MQTTTDWTFTLGAPHPLWTVSAVVVAAALLLALAFVEGRRLRPRRRVGLVLLRVATLLLAALVVLQPTWTRERLEHLSGRVAVLLDASRSMTIDGPGGRERRAQARKLAQRWAGEATPTAVSVYTVGDRLEPTTLAALAGAYPADEDASRLAWAVHKLVSEDEAGDLGAIVVVSDGADPALDAHDGVLSDAGSVALGVRVHTVAIGAGGALKDDAIADVQVDPIAFLRQDATAHVTLRSIGGAGARRVPVTLTHDGSVVRREDVDLPADGEASVDLRFTPARVGRALYRLSIPVEPGDAVPANNEHAFLVRVERDKTRVLLVSGEPSWDERFLRAFLKSDPSIELISFFILRTANDLPMAPASELALIPFPTDEHFREYLGTFDLVIFQNFDHRPYRITPYLPRIRDYVRRGGAFAMIGGDGSFGSGGYGGTPIADILPVRMPSGKTAASDLVDDAPFSPRVVDDLSRHPLLALLPDPRLNAALWRSLAPLIGVNRVARPRAGAQVLLQDPNARAIDGGPAPVVAVGEAGQGRALAVMTDTTWRWGMTSGGEGADPSSYARFWDHAVRWLTRDPSFDPAQLTTDRERYGIGAAVQVDGLLRDGAYRPIAGAAIALTIEGAKGHVVGSTVAQTDGDGRVHAQMTAPTTAGGYEVVARREGAEAALASVGFIVETGGRELADPRPHPERLEALSKATGGHFYPTPESAPALGAFDATRVRSLGVVDVAPFAAWWVLVAAAVLFGVEWWLRRRWGRR